MAPYPGETVTRGTAREEGNHKGCPYDQSPISSSRSLIIRAVRPQTESPW